MKLRNIFFGLLILTFTASCGSQAAKEQSVEKTEITEETKALLAEGMTVEAACGECQFGLKGSTCELAVRINGIAYFVDGAHIDDYGDAHAEDGLCQMIHEADVKGKIVDGRFIAESFELHPADARTHDDDHTHEH